MPVNIIPDYLRPGLDLVIVGINPGAKSAERRRHYAHPGNHFWPLLHESGLVSEPLTWADDERVLEWNIGLTNLVDRASRSITDLTLAEMQAGARRLRRKLLASAPAVVCFNGKRIYEVYAGQACPFGVQAARIGDALVYVMPSTSARAAAYQRPDKLAHFIALKRLVDASRRQAVAS